ncbi:MAG: VOC family protein [Candidatus Xenobiia bacterium LiM19]
MAVPEATLQISERTTCAMKYSALCLILASFLFLSAAPGLCQSLYADTSQPVARPAVQFGHIAIAIPSGVKLESAMKWYQQVMGFEKAWEIKEADMKDRAASDLPRRLFGDGFQKVRYVKMIAGENGMAIELFEFVNAVPPSGKADYVRNGYIHMCVAVDKPEALAEAIVKAGGKEIWRSAPDNKQKAFFCSDPWGNVIEIFSAPGGAERS